MKRFIVFGGGLLGIFIAFGLLALIQFGIHDCSQGDGAEVIVDATCVVEDTIADDHDVTLKLDCQGQKIVVRNSKVVVSYLKNPGPLTCTVYKSTIYKSGKVKCQLRE